MSKGAYIKHPNTEGLGWRDRLREWTRWTIPIQKNAEYEVRLDATEPTNLEIQRSPQLPDPNHTIEGVKPLEVVGAVVNEFSEPDSSSPQGLSYWSAKPFTSSSILVGSVLHSHPNEKSARATKLLKSNRSEVLHAFSSGVPNLSQILTHATLLRAKQELTPVSQPTPSRIKPVESLILRFLPNPFQISDSDNQPVGASALDAFPPVEMRFDIDPENREAKLRETQVVIQEDISDIMLPEQAVDLRFEQRQTRRLRRKYIPQIKQYLEQSDLCLAGGQLETPAKIRLPISRHICKDQGLQLLSGHPDADQDVAEVEYLFAALEIRSTIALSFKGLRLLYTSIEAGKAGGRRSELKVRSTSERTGKTIETEQDFIAAGYELAECLTDPQSLITPRKIKSGRDEPVNRFVRLGLRREHKGAESNYSAKKLGIRTVAVRSDKERAKAWGNGFENGNSDQMEIGAEAGEMNEQLGEDEENNDGFA